jgi:hypothetical protein
MKTAAISPDPAKFQRSAEHSTFQRFNFQHFSSNQAPLFPRNPLFPASGPATSSFNGLHPKSKFLAFIHLYARKGVHRTQTDFLLNQINEVAATSNLVRTQSELIQLLEKSHIDWNSCKLTSSEVLDSWGNPLLFDFGGIPDQFEMRSAGPDGRMNTKDDIHKVIQAPKPTP